MSAFSPPTIQITDSEALLAREGLRVLSTGHTSSTVRQSARQLMSKIDALRVAALGAHFRAVPRCLRAMRAAGLLCWSSLPTVLGLAALLLLLCVATLGLFAPIGITWDQQLQQLVAQAISRFGGGR